ncbi:amine oxidase [Metarhizium album ARSEF 1941]|uniref:Amine oxidase n=1 Tax=Metarhizium album (strain ARSEF 1941) TaxID=1081103 RepID=A0A0B2WJ48_METAS|nr:amine oxidase [Metarhizium album ARSEF 1941]KHN93903.1 amine oxidase [Metarhizium album ARSEF 1941]
MSLSEPRAPKRRHTSTSQPSIAIIGAGLAGLRCADVLVQNGISVTIIEARDRIGGRVHQGELPGGRAVDLGPNWIHGTDDNPILDIAKQTNTAAGSLNSNVWVHDHLGGLMSQEDGEKYSAMVWDLVQQAFEHSNTHGAETHADKSLLDFVHERISDMIPESDAECAKKRGVLVRLVEMWGTFVGSPVSRQSLKYFWLEECLEGENLFCAGTYKKILHHIADPAVTGADLMLNSKVTKVTRQYQSSNKVKIELDSGRHLLFDEVVVTAPLGWLKRHPDAFNPRLPARLTEAISAIGYGCLEKVYITFPTAFWLVSMRMRGFIEWITPTYAPSNPHQWHQDAFELGSLPEPHNHPTLLFYTFGEQSKYMTSTLAKLTTQSQRTAFLVDFFQPYYSLLPNYSADSPDCKPLALLATEWLNDEFAGNGSYCNFQVGLEKGDEDIEVMRHGLPDQGIWFAGEHTAPFVALGTATGAYWSGEMVAKRIVDTYARLKQS